ncbi:MAG TPA: PD-(D/E)XK nuclease family protein [Gammaproteobacteria bacterium]|nr:PD-(D/E)XK nuclease family protein [Gammaproteobacteria bacterium]
MTQRLLQQDAILAALAGGATVVTAGERLTRAVQWAYAEARQAAGRWAWERPNVLSWPAFLAQLGSAHEGEGMQGAGAPPRLLSAIQAETLWTSVVRASGAASGLLQPRAAAQAAQEAWALCHAYRLDPAGFAKSGSADAEQFSAWARVYLERCRRERWLDVARLPEQLASWVRAGALPVPARVVFAGFHEWPPQLEDFLQALHAAGSAAERLVTDIASAENARRVACADQRQELRTAARWAAALLERNPALRIGIVVHDLAACGPQLRRELDDALCPSARLGVELERPYNLSLGSSLASAPVIHDALLLLQILVHDRMDFSAASQVLRSPFVRAAESEQSARLRLELRLREAGERISLQRLAALARAESGLQQLTTALTAVLDWKNAHAKRLLPAAWARSFADALRLWGWPGERTHDSVEHQALDALRGILGELARLDVLAETQDMDGALAEFSRLAAQEIFQPATPDTPVQVLGVLEATSLHFDHLWIAGWSDDAWPASPRPHALIPVSVQREHDMPHAGARHEFEFAQRLTAHLLAAAPDVVVSVPQRDADRELRPSPLISALPEIGPNQLQLPQRVLSGHAQLLHAAAPPLETLDDSLGPALDTGQVRGGTNVLKSQAACAFQAFARYRLGADQPLRTPSPGLDAAERGSLLHRVLYRLYGELTDQAAILGKDDAALAAVIQRSVAAVLREARGAAPEIFTPRFQALEQERLSQLIRDWLPQERERAKFSVAERELKRTVQIGPLQLHTRVDRIDRLRDGSYAIIDYKTGDAKPAAWQGERPDEPQLPCYAVTAAEDVAAVLFAVLRPGETEYRGYARASDTAPRVTGLDELKNPPDDCANWPALLDHWRTVLTRLAADFAAGAAKVAPKERNRTCRVCHLANLCRIDEIQALGEPDDD